MEELERKGHSLSCKEYTWINICIYYFYYSIVPLTYWHNQMIIGIGSWMKTPGLRQLMGSNIWKKAGVYYMQTGNICVLNEYGRDPKNPLHHKMRGDWVDLFKSTDLKHWQYLHRFYDRDPTDKWTDGTEEGSSSPPPVNGISSSSKGSSPRNGTC